MAKLDVPFANQLGQSTVTQNSREILVNMFAEVQVSGRSQIIRRQRACLELVVELAGEKRAVEKNAGVHYMVVGDKFYTFDGAALTERGTLDTEAGACSIVFDDNGDVGISDGTTLYHWTGSTFSKPTTQSAVGTLTFIGGFAVYNEPESGRFWWSSTNNMQAWDGLDFATAEGKPDVLLRVTESYKQLWLWGAETTEIWSLEGGQDRPFSPYTVMERGIGASYSVVSEDNSQFFLGNDWIFYRADGYRPVMVSNPAVQAMVATVPEEHRANCWGFAYTDGFNKFVTWVFPGYLTLQLNLSTNFWNVARTYERDDWDVLGSQFTRSDYVLSGAGISRLTRDLNTDNGEAVWRGGVSAPLADGLARVLINSFVLDVEVGRASIGVDPRIMMRIARDGESFGNERWRSLGEQGHYRRLVTWRNLGIGRRQTIEMGMSDDAELTIMGAALEAEVLDG
jgi:hypothetical protein